MMHNRAKKCAALFTALLCLPAAGQDPLADFLHRRGYDRDAILRQFPPDPPPNAILTSPDSATDSPADTAADADSENSDNNNGADNSPNAAVDSPNAAADSQNDAGDSQKTAPAFLPLRPRFAPDSANSIALILPTLAAGAAGQAARNFYRGCLHGAEFDGGGAEIQLYPFAGESADAVRNYAAAVERGAAVAAGPMLKKNVRALLAAYPQTPLRTLLLQPGGGGEYFVMTLDAAREAGDLARMLHQHFGGGTAMIVEQLGPRGEKMRAAFSQQWTAAGGALPVRFVIRDAARDWRRLFDMLKEEEGEAAVIFAAGDSAFAAQVRGFAPQRYSVFAASTATAGGGGGLLLENLGVMEMPWFVGLDDSIAALDSPSARALPDLRRRFFALGADACRAMRRAPGWREGWILRGLAGDWQLQNGVFVRAGKLAVHRAGRLQPL